jgi:hypothetical protein
MNKGSNINMQAKYENGIQLFNESIEVEIIIKRDSQT